MKLEKLEMKENKPTKLKFVEKDELPLFAQVKLKKASIPERKVSQPAIVVPKVLLKSNIKRIEWPPKERHLTISEINAIPDNGILSRNYQEAMKIKKKKLVKINLPDLERAKLETYEPTDYNKKLHTESLPESIKHSGVTKPIMQEDSSNLKIELGKGVVPQDVNEDENIKLKPLKPINEDLKEAPIERKKTLEDLPIVDLPLAVDEPLDLNPLDEIGSINVTDTPEYLKKPEKPIDEDETSGKKPKKIVKKPSNEKDLPDDKQLILGKPKPAKPEKPEDINLIKAQGDLPPEPSDSIALKPFRKEKPEKDSEPKQLGVGKPKPFDQDREESSIEPKMFEDADDKTKKKKKKKKDTPSLSEQDAKPDEVAEEKEYEINPESGIDKTELVAEEAHPIEEFKEEDVELKPKHLNKDEVPVKLKKPVSKKVVDVIDKTEQLKKPLLKSRIKRIPYPPKEQIPKISVLPKVTMDKGALSRNYKESLKIKKQKLKLDELPDLESAKLETFEPTEFMPQKPNRFEQEQKIPAKPSLKDEEELPEANKIKIGEGEVPDNQDDKETVVLKPFSKELPDKTFEKKTPEDLLQQMTPDKQPHEGVIDGLTIKKEVPEEKLEEVSSEVVVKKKKPKSQPVEEVAEEITIKKEVPEEKPEEVLSEVVVKKKKPKSKPVDDDDVSESVTIGKPSPKQINEEDVSSNYVLKKKQKKQSIAEADESITIQKLVPQDETEDVESITFVPRKTKQKEDIEQEFNIQMKDYEEEEVSLSGKVCLPKKLKPFVKSEDASAEMTIEQIVVEPEDLDEQPSTDKKNTEDEVPDVKPTELTSDVVMKKKKSKPQPVEEVAEEITIKKEVPEGKPEEVLSEVVVKKKKPKSQPVEEVAEEITIMKKVPEEKPDEVSSEVVLKEKKPKSQPVDDDVSESVTIGKPSAKQSNEEDVSNNYVLKKKQKKQSIAEADESITIQKLVPQDDTEDVESITFVPRKTKQKEDIEQEFNIQMKDYEEEEVSLSGKVRLPRKPKPFVQSEDASAEMTIEQMVEEPESPAADVKFPLRRKSSITPYSIEETEESFQVGFKQQPRQSVVYEEESLELKIKRRPSKPVVPTFHQEGAELSITKEEVISERDMSMTESHEGDALYSICSYEAENEDALSLVEGEKVYVIESTSSDWWFVQKHLTEEKGWVPAVYLRDEPSYTLYIQKKLHEKIDKLPIFEKPGPGDEVFAPRFVEKLQPKHAPDGATIQFECQVEGNPRPQITWFRQTAIIKPSPDFQIFYDEDNVATLIIKEVFPEDAGAFTCVAKNAAGFASSTTELIVEAPLSDHGSDATGLSRKSLSRESSLADILEGIPPTFSKKPKAKVVDKGEDVELEVRLVAVPEPEVTWLLNGKEIKQSDRVKFVTQSDMHMYSSILTIKNSEKTDQGQYTVIAKNREGEATLDIVVKVKSGAAEPPEIVEPLQDVVIFEGEGAILSTQITGNPKPEVKWLKNGKAAPQLPTTVQDDIHTLTLSKLTHTDSARYTVKAVNKHGKAETSATVTVEDFPGPQAPLFTDRFEEQTVKEKGTIRLAAKVIGNPTPMVTWFRNNKTLLASSRNTEQFDGENIVLEIRDADSEVDSGDYKCVASNSVGTATHGARITVDVEKVFFTRQLESRVEVNEAHTVVLECETSHTVSTKWQHNGVEVSGMDHRELVQEGRLHKLIIKKCKSSDAGNYTCSVKGQQTSSLVVVKDMKPDFTRMLEDIEVKETEGAILEVEVTSETANVTWHKDGEQIAPSPDKFVMEKKGNIRKLLIRSTSVHDEGEYTCSLGDQECTAEVTVIELPPEIKTKLQDITVTRGEKAILEVELTKGDALVRWFKDDKELQFSEHVQLSIDGKRQKLKIYQAELSDGGIYSCRVGDQVSDARVTVEEPAVEFILGLPDVTLVPINSDAVFTVQLSNPDVPVKWLKKGKEIKPSSKYIITSDGATRTLTIKNASNEDQSDYTCVAINVKTTTKLKVETIESAPKIIPEKKEYRVKKGEDITISVKFTSCPPPKEEWHVNGTVIKKSKRMKPTIDESSASLTITKVEEVDVGEYTIVLTNKLGEASEKLSVIIMEVPGAPSSPEIIETSDNSVTLHWSKPKFDGNSEITNYILEYHDKDEFLTWHEVKETITETTYTVSGLTTGAQYMFKVSAVNVIGKGPASDPSSYATVKKPTGSEAPAIKEPLTDVSVSPGQATTLEAVITGVPTPEVKWMKDGKALKSKDITFEKSVAKYVLKEAKETSGGVYSIKATNTAGSAESSCTVTVQESPKLEVEPNQENQCLRIMSQWKPEVKFSGYPKPDIKWTKDEDLIESDNRCKIYVDETTSTIAIYSVERKDTGTYAIKASNSAGSAYLQLSLRVIDKPSKPEGPITVRDMHKDSVTIEWNKPKDCGGLELIGYFVEKCDVSKMVWTKVGDVEKDSTHLTIRRLQEDSQYMFRVFAQNSVGISEALESETVTIKSTIDYPGAPEGPLEVSGMTETSCTIKWNAPESDGGTPIIDYTVEQKESSKKAWQKVGVTRELYISISQMKMNTDYDFRITARNKVGTGPPYYSDEPITAGKRITPPSAPTDFAVTDITSKSVALKWGPPESSGGTELTGYIIEKQSMTSSKWTRVVTLDASVLQYTIENLKEKSEFYFRIYAENSIGLSTPASTGLVSLSTHATVPSPPTAPLEVRVIASHTIMIEWGVPETDGGAPLEGYKIAIRDMKKTMWMEVGQVRADVQKLSVKDLQEGHEYMIRIFARNEVGLSDPLETEEPFLVVRPTGMEEDMDMEEMGLDKDTPSISYSTENTTSWMREAGMDADIQSYARGSLLRRSEYFFRIWYYAKHLFR